MINVRSYLKKNKIFFIVTLFLTNLYGYKLSPYIYDGLLHNECLKKKGKCYPYFIRVNSKQNIIKTIIANRYSMKASIIDCRSEKLCINLAKELIDKKITNFDMGPFQVNYYHHSYLNINKMFNIISAKEGVTIILKNLINKYGYSWETLGKYNSFEKEKNRIYYIKLYTYLRQNNML